MPGPAPTPTGGPSPAGGPRASDSVPVESDSLPLAEKWWNALYRQMVIERIRGAGVPPKAPGHVVESLKNGLADEHWWNRAAAALALAKAGGADGRVKAMKDDAVPEARQFAILALGYGAESSGEAELAAILLDGDKDPSSRSAAAIAIGLTRSGGASDSLKMGYSVAADIKTRGSCLAGLHLADSRDALLEIALRDSEIPVLRALAAGFAGRESGGGPAQASYPALKSILQSRGSPLCLRRAAALSLRGHDQAFEALLDCAETEKNSLLRGFCFVSAARIPGADPRRKKELGRKLALAFGEVAPIAEKAMVAVAGGFNGSEEMAQPMLSTLSDSRFNPDLRAWCARALGIMRHEKALPALSAILRKRLPDPATLAAIEAIGLGGFSGGADTLESILNGSSKALVEPAAFALAALGEAGLPALRRGVAGGGAEVRVRCARALGLSRRFEFAGGPVEPDSPAFRAEIYGAIGDNWGPAASPLDARLAADLDPEAVSEALHLVRE